MKSTEQEALLRDKKILTRALMVRQARDNLVPFMKLMMPDSTDPEDAALSRFVGGWHHDVLSEKLLKLEKGEIKRLIITMPPRHSKSETCTRSFPTFYMGKRPQDQIIIAGYSETFAQEEFGREIRNIMLSPQYAQVFPGTVLDKNSKSAGFMMTEQRGKISVTGVGGKTTGKGADLLIIDDPIKNSAHADSETERNNIWDWYMTTARTRLQPGGRILIVMCMTGDTPVLMASGVEKPLADIVRGDIVATYDNDKLSHSRVMNVINQGYDFVFKIRMTSGRTIRANARHPFLINVSGKPQWIKTKNLHPGQEIYRVNGESGKVRNVLRKGVKNLHTAVDFARLTIIKSVGLMGCAPLLQKQIPHPESARNSSIGTESRSCNIKKFLQGKTGLVQFANVRQRMQKIHPIGITFFALTTVMTRKKLEVFYATRAIWLLVKTAALKLWRPLRITSDFTLDVIESIELDGKEEVYDVQIERTENFIANGYVSHNTRWHEDDLVGRILDPERNSPETIAQWDVLHLPALRDPIDGLASRNDETSIALWPNWQPKSELLALKGDVDSRTWSALYQGSPTPEDGDYFTRAMVKEYGDGAIDSNGRKVICPPLDELRVYQSMDLAVSQEKRHDASCLLTVGVDKDENIWVLDALWERRPADSLIDAMLYEMQRYDPLIVWGERGQITKSLGPFIRKRMVELGIYAYIEEESPVVDKTVRSRSIRARMAMGKVFFPKNAVWFEDAVSELVKFPAGRHDDFVDCLSWIGMGLEREVGHIPQTVVKKHKVGTIGWIKNQSKVQEQFNLAYNNAEW